MHEYFYKAPVYGDSPASSSYAVEMFEILWALDDNWLEPRNERRNGWSGMVHANIGGLAVWRSM